MTTKPAISIKQLLRASSDDEDALRYPLQDSGYGFHAQQAVEKLYKALIARRQGRYPFSHDLKSLRKHLESLGCELPVCAFRLEELSDYAGNARYEDPMPLSEATRAVLQDCIAALRRYVLSETAEIPEIESKV